MEQLISENYLQFGALGLLGSYLLLFVYSFTGNKTALKSATRQYGLIILVIALTPFIITSLKT